MSIGFYASFTCDIKYQPDGNALQYKDIGQRGPAHATAGGAEFETVF
jgi:hypothetical protein